MTPVPDTVFQGESRGSNEKLKEARKNSKIAKNFKKHRESHDTEPGFLSQEIAVLLLAVLLLFIIIIYYYYLLLFIIIIYYYY